MLLNTPNRKKVKVDSSTLNFVNSMDHSTVADAEDVDEDITTDSDCEPEPLEITECLFCPNKSKNFEANLNHMSVKHGFYIPDLNYLTDIRGLMQYLCEKVGVGVYVYLVQHNRKGFSLCRVCTATYGR